MAFSLMSFSSRVSIGWSNGMERSSWPIEWCSSPLMWLIQVFEPMNSLFFYPKADQINHVSSDQFTYAELMFVIKRIWFIVRANLINYEVVTKFIISKVKIMTDIFELNFKIFLVNTILNVMAIIIFLWN